ncbi:CHAT domain-containing protein [soil metagenome]
MIRTLLDRVAFDPAHTLAEATKQLAASPDAATDLTARLHQVVGLARRDLGDLDGAARALEQAAAVALAGGHDHDHVAASIQATLAFVVAQLGDLDRALELFGAAEPRVRGTDLDRLLSNLGAVLFWKGDLDAAATTLLRAVDRIARSEPVAVAKVKANLGAVLAQLGRYDEAERHLHDVLSLRDPSTVEVFAAVAMHNLGFLALMRGDVPAALTHLADAEQMFLTAGADSYQPQIWADQAAALADAMMLDDAAELLGQAQRRFEELGQRTEGANALLTAARIKLASGDFVTARTEAEAAVDVMRSEHRESWSAVAEQVVLRARALGGDGTLAVAALLDGNAADLDRLGWGVDATQARLVSAQLKIEQGSGAASPVDRDLRRTVARGREVDRIALAHLDALAATRRGDARGARRAITMGLRVAMAVQSRWSSIETRAHAASHGYALTELGARLALADGRPGELLGRIEATRLMTSRLPSVRPPADEQMAAMLTDLRAAESVVASGDSPADDRQAAEQRLVRLERSIRNRGRALRGTESDATTRVDREIRQALTMLDESGRQLVAHAALDGDLVAVSRSHGRTRLHRLGRLDHVSSMLDVVTFALNRLNRSVGSESSRLAAAEMLHMSAEELSEIVLPPLVAEAPDDVVVVPTSILHDVPWGLLASLAGRAVSVNPSLSAWARAETSMRQRGPITAGSDVGFIAGPHLDHAELEVTTVAGYYQGPRLVVGAAATGHECEELMSQCDLVHIACHGMFRADNPMFSSLHLADGPLNVYDLERLHQMPAAVVLSACSVGGGRTLAGGAILGLATALLTLGASTVIAPLTPISDAASVTVMQRVHGAIVEGATASQALARAIVTHDVADPTAAAFIALGA